MPTGCFSLLFFVSHPQSFDLGRWILVNTKSSTPVARAFSCLPTLTNPALTDTHCQANYEINNCGITKVGVFSLGVTAQQQQESSKKQRIPRGAEIHSSPQKKCSILLSCLVWEKGRDQRKPAFPGVTRWSLRMSDCTWWRGKWAAAGEAFWPSWPGRRAL